MSKFLTLLCLFLLSHVAIVQGKQDAIDSHEDVREGEEQDFAEGEEAYAGEGAEDGIDADDENEEGSDEEDEELTEEDKAEVFLQSYDIDGDKKISWAELDGEADGEDVQGSDAKTKEANEKKQLDDADDDDAKALFKKADADGDGHLSLTEIPSFLAGHMNGGKDDF